MFTDKSGDALPEKALSPSRMTILLCKINTPWCSDLRWARDHHEMFAKLVPPCNRSRTMSTQSPARCCNLYGLLLRLLMWSCWLSPCCRLVLSLSPNVGHVLRQPFHGCLDRADERQVQILQCPVAKHTAKVSDWRAVGRNTRAVVLGLRYRWIALVFRAEHLLP